MTRKKRNTKDDYEQDDLDIEEQTHRKGGLRRHRASRQDQMDPLAKMNDVPPTQSGKKGDTKND